MRTFDNLARTSLLLLVSAALTALLAACGAAKSVEKSDLSAVAESAPVADVADTACENSRAAALAAWQHHFNRVQELSPEDRTSMATEHANLPDSELESMQASATEGGDDKQLEAIASTRTANATCG